MRKSIWLALTAGMVLVLAGCNDSSAEAKKYDCQQWLNSGSYDKVISNASQCGNTQEQQMYRAAAHAGKGGFTISGLIADLTSDDEDADFVERLGRNATAAKMQDLNDSKRIYGLLIAPSGNNTKAALNAVCMKDSEEYNASTRYQKDACFIRPLVSIAQLAGQMKRLRDATDADDVDSEELANMINTGELDLLAASLGKDDAETAESIDEVKRDICEVQTDSSSGAEFEACLDGGITAAGIDAYANK